jgi:hypothetical protein
MSLLSPIEKCKVISREITNDIQVIAKKGGGLLYNLKITHRPL